MDAQRFLIKGKSRVNPDSLLVSLQDFQYADAEDVDPDMVVARSTISLFCLDPDTRHAIFVETPPDVDLSQAPFYYQTQYETAEALIAVPYHILRQIAADITVDPHRITLIYSTGRCGSTLVSHAFSHAAGIYSFSEPDVFTQLVALRAADGSTDGEVSSLVRDCTKVMLAGARNHGASGWALKFRSFGIELGDLFFHQFPEAKVVFLYRNLEGYARSVARVGRLFEPEGQQALPSFQQAFNHLSPLVGAYSATHTTTIPPLEICVCLWVSVMQRCIDLQQQGVPMLCARYEELRAAPYTMLDAIFAYCGVTVSDPAVLGHVLAQDSQAGTGISQTNLQQSTSILTDAHVQALHQLLQHYAPTFTHDMILPHTFLPQGF